MRKIFFTKETKPTTHYLNAEDFESTKSNNKMIENLDFQLLQLNAQSLSNKLEVLMLEEDPDILSIAEHWCDVDKP